MTFEKISDILRWMPAKSCKENRNEWLPFIIHSYDTAKMMEMLGKHWISEGMRERLFPELEWKELINLLCFIGMVHDIGKLTPAFQGKILKDLPEVEEQLYKQGMVIPTAEQLPNRIYSPHAAASQAILMRLGLQEDVADIAGAHHGKPQSLAGSLVDQTELYYENYFGIEGPDSLEGRRWYNLWDEWLSFSLEESDYVMLSELPHITAEQQVFLSGLLITADWIASNHSYYSLIDTAIQWQEPYGMRTEDAWAKLSLADVWSPTYYEMDAELFQTVFHFHPNTVQQGFMEICNEASYPGIYIIEAQMGVGKTEAALAGAGILASKFGCTGLYFGLPTQATANALFERLKSWAIQESEDTQHSIRLAHAMAQLNDEYQSIFHGTASVAMDEDEETRLIIHPWFEGKKQALLADFVSGTVDQLLLMALKQKHVMLRHVGMAGKVVIVDECHAYDTYMNGYLDRVLTWLGVYQVPVIILSATLPVKRRVELIEAYLGRKKPDAEWKTNFGYPIITWTDGIDVFQKQVEVSSAGKSVSMLSLEKSDMINIVEKVLQVEGCVGIIVNTVHESQKITQLLREIFPTVTILLLHSSFTMQDRIKKEKSLMERLGKRSTMTQRKRVIVVGTQVLEQSLDVDFDSLITEICPMDLLLQRIGRLHRHNRQRPSELQSPNCYVMGWKNEISKGSQLIYGEWLLYRTREVLPEQVVLPNDIPSLVQEVYREPDGIGQLSQEMQKAWQKFEQKNIDKKNRAKTFCIAKPNTMDDILTGWLDCDQICDETTGNAAVRDTDNTITVVILMQSNEGELAFVPWQYGGKKLPVGESPNAALAKQILTQRLNLPRVFCNGKRYHQVLESLEKMTNLYVPEWRQSPWLQNELVLVLDQTLHGVLDSYQIRYTEAEGFVYEKEGDALNE